MLKIGTSKVGSVVDCPRCQHFLIVPPQSTPQAEEAYRMLKNKRAQHTAPTAAIATMPTGETPEEDIEDVNMPLWMEESWILMPPDSQEWQEWLPTSAANPVLTEELAIHTLEKQHKLTVTLLCTALVITFFVGIIFGILFRGFSVQPVHTGSHADASGTGNQVTGMLYYFNENGERRADVDAVVMCLPKDKQPNSLFSCQGLRPGDVVSNDTVQMIHEMGGIYERTDANGTFTLQYQEGVRYFVILISAHQSGTGHEMKPSVLSELRRYFRDPELFGEYCMSADEYEWDKPTLRHTFESTD